MQWKDFIPLLLVLLGALFAVFTNGATERIKLRIELSNRSRQAASRVIDLVDELATLPDYWPTPHRSDDVSPEERSLHRNEQLNERKRIMRAIDLAACEIRSGRVRRRVRSTLEPIIGRSRYGSPGLALEGPLLYKGLYSDREAKSSRESEYRRELCEDAIATLGAYIRGERLPEICRARLQHHVELRQPLDRLANTLSMLRNDPRFREAGNSICIERRSVRRALNREDRWGRFAHFIPRRKYATLEPPSSHE